MSDPVCDRCGAGVWAGCDCYQEPVLDPKSSRARILELEDRMKELEEDAEAWRWLCENLPDGFRLADAVAKVKELEGEVKEQSVLREVNLRLWKDAEIRAKELEEALEWAQESADFNRACADDMKADRDRLREENRRLMLSGRGLHDRLRRADELEAENTRLRELLAFVLADADPDSVCVLYDEVRRYLEGREQ